MHLPALLWASLPPGLQDYRVTLVDSRVTLADLVFDYAITYGCKRRAGGEAKAEPIKFIFLHLS